MNVEWIMNSQMNAWMNEWFYGIHEQNLIRKILCEYEQIISTSNKQKTWNAWTYLYIIESGGETNKNVVKSAEWETHQVWRCISRTWRAIKLNQSANILSWYYVPALWFWRRNNLFWRSWIFSVQPMKMNQWIERKFQRKHHVQMKV